MIDLGVKIGASVLKQLALPAGVYFLCDGEQVVYVGKSRSIVLRLGGHRKKRFTKVFYIEVADLEDRQELERFFICLLRPKYNIQEHKKLRSKVVNERFFREFGPNVPAHLTQYLTGIPQYLKHATRETLEELASDRWVSPHKALVKQLLKDCEDGDLQK